MFDAYFPILSEWVIDAMGGETHYFELDFDDLDRVFGVDSDACFENQEPLPDTVYAGCEKDE